MQWLRQIVIVSCLNVLTIPQRYANALVTLIAVGCVVGVFVAVLSMAAGLQYAVNSAGAADNVIVLSTGATSEFSSNISREENALIAEASGIRRGETGEALASPEFYIAVRVRGAPVTLRGLTETGLKVRRGAKIREGRAFREGTSEIVLGRQVADRLKDVTPGSALQMANASWTVVGIFDDDGSVSESEIWCDLRVLQQHFKRVGVFQSVRLSLAPGADAASIEAQLARDQRSSRLTVQSERAYYASQSKGMTAFIKAIGYPLTIVMVLGAVVAVINTMYASVSARRVEIATLRALGYAPFSVGFSALAESMVLALCGGLLGALFVYVFLNGYSISTLSRETASQVSFGFTVTKDLVRLGLLAALTIGLLGGLFPAVRAARLPVAAGLRED